MSALAGDAILLIALAALAGFMEARARATLRSIHDEFSKLYALLTAMDARIALSERKPNGAGHFTPTADVSARRDT